MQDSFKRHRVRAEMRKAVQSIVMFIERAHGLRAQTAGFEFVVGFDGAVHLIGGVPAA